MMRVSRPLCRCGLGRADVHATVELEGVSVDHLAVEPLRQDQGQIALAGSSRTHDGDHGRIGRFIGQMGHNSTIPLAFHSVYNDPEVTTAMSEMFDKAKETAQTVADQVKETVGGLADEHGGKVSDAVKSATDFIDEKTGGSVSSVTGKVSELTDTAVSAVKGVSDGPVQDAANSAKDAAGSAADAATDAADKATGA